MANKCHSKSNGRFCGYRGPASAPKAAPQAPKGMVSRKYGVIITGVRRVRRR